MPYSNDVSDGFRCAGIYVALVAPSPATYRSGGRASSRSILRPRERSVAVGGVAHINRALIRSVPTSSGVATRSSSLSAYNNEKGDIAGGPGWAHLPTLPLTAKKGIPAGADCWAPYRWWTSQAQLMR
jgi:hypothetical protein